MFGIGLPEMVIIVVIALIFIGPQQLPDVIRSVGRGLVQLKRATNDIRTTVQDEMSQIEKELDVKELKDVKDEVQNTIGNVSATFNPLGRTPSSGEELEQLADRMEGKPAAASEEKSPAAQAITEAVQKQVAAREAKEAAAAAEAPEAEAKPEASPEAPAKSTLPS